MMSGFGSDINCGGKIVFRDGRAEVRRLTTVDRPMHRIEIEEIPGAGRKANFVDPDGNRVSFLEIRANT